MKTTMMEKAPPPKPEAGVPADIAALSKEIPKLPQKTELVQLSPENPEHVKALSALDAATATLKNEYTDAYDAGVMTEAEIKQWMTEEPDDLRGLTNNGKPEKPIEAFVRAYPDDKGRKRTLKGRHHMRADSAVEEIAFGKLPDMPNDAVAEGLSGFLADRLEDRASETDKPLTFTLYLGADETDSIAIAQKAGFRNVDTVVYDDDPAPSTAFVANDRDIRLAQSRNARSVLETHAAQG